MGFNRKTPTNGHLLPLLLILHALPVFPQSKPSSLLQNQVLRDGQSQTLVSPGQIFELGFFSPKNSTSRFIGIWYYKLSDQTITWVANRNAPIAGKSGLFGIGSNGSLTLSDANGRIYWSSNTNSAGKNLTAMLMDTGNLILSTIDNAGDDSNAIWQSCHHPTDTYLPNLRIYLNITKGDSNKFVSWKNLNDPSEGNYAMGIDPQGSPQIVVWEQDSGGPGHRIWRSGYWNYQIFTGVPKMRSLLLFGFRLIPVDGGLMYFIFNNPNSTPLMRFLIHWDGIAQQLTWDEGSLKWNVSLSQPATECEKYNKCGSFGLCGMRDSVAVCGCMQGFEPNSNRGESSVGCFRQNPLQCGLNGSTSDGFSRRNGVKLPDFANALVAGSRERCEEGCLRNCSCNAYAYISGVGCLIWGGDLVDVEQFEEGGETLFIRLASSDLGMLSVRSHSSRMNFEGQMSFSFNFEICQERLCFFVKKS